jgi:hypothetical protein
MENITVPNTLNARKLQAMAFVAAMKEAADKAGCGFVGGFIADNGEKFVMTNMDAQETEALLPDHLRDDI